MGASKRWLHVVCGMPEHDAQSQRRPPVPMSDHLSPELPHGHACARCSRTAAAVVIGRVCAHTTHGPPMPTHAQPPAASLTHPRPPWRPPRS